MEALIGLVVAIALVLLGKDVLDNRKKSKLSSMSEELDEIERDEQYLLGETDARVEDLEERVRAREENHEEVSKDSPERAADRLRNEFGSKGD